MSKWGFIDPGIAPVLDKSHSLSRGLATFITPGVDSCCPVTRMTYRAANGANMTRGFNRVGPCANYDGTNQRYNTFVHPQLLDEGLTIALHGMDMRFATAFADLVAYGIDGNSFPSIVINGNSGRFYFAARVVGEGWNDYTGGVRGPLQNDFAGEELLIYRVDARAATNLANWTMVDESGTRDDGQATNSDTTGIGGVAMSDTNSNFGIRFGDWEDNTSGTVNATWWWRRHISDVELEMFLENPYGMFQQKPILAGNTQRRYFGGAVVRNGFMEQ